MARQSCGLMIRARKTFVHCLAGRPFLFTSSTLLEGQKVIASFSRVPTRPGVSINTPALEKLRFAVDDFNATEDFNKYYVFFPLYFCGPK